MHAAPLIRGEITFDSAVRPFTGATLYVHLENITDADIASTSVAIYVEREVSFDPRAAKPLTFAIAGKAPDPGASYVVRAHIDLDDDGEVSRGDFVSTQSYPVITFGHPTEITLVVRQVK